MTISIEPVGQPGLITEEHPARIPVTAWNRADNIRFDRTGAHAFDGNRAVLSGALFAPYWLMPWKASTGFSWIYAGLSKLGRITGVNHSDVTRYTTTPGDNNYTWNAKTVWSGALLGDWPIITSDNGVDVPQGYDGSKFVDLANWPAGAYAQQTFVIDRFAVMMKITENGVFNPREVWWSEPADPGTYPNSWDYANPATISGKVTLAETEGPIVTAKILRNSALIYKTDSVIAMRHVGGQSVFSFQPIFTDFGALGPYCVAAFGNKHFVVTSGDVLVHDGQSYESVISKRNRKIFFTDIQNAYVDRTQVTVYEQREEVWISYVSSASTNGMLDKALIWNWRDDTWSFRELHNYAFIAPGYVDETAQSLIINDQTQAIDSVQTPIDSQPATPVLDELLACDPIASKFQLLNTGTTFDGATINCRLERQSLPITGKALTDETVVSYSGIHFVRRFRPRLQATGPVDVYVGTQRLPESPVQWLGPFTFDASTQSHFDFRLSANFFSLRFESAADVTWTLLGYDLDIDYLGENV